MDITTVTAEVLAAAEHVPFGNSAFQTAMFTGGDEGPERRGRTLLLNMDQRLQALEEARYGRLELSIDLEEIEAKLSALTALDDPHGIGCRRLELERDRKTSGLARADKLIRDALIELEVMYREWKSLPPVESREQFEAAEPGYWTRRLWADACREIAASGAPAPGTLAALNQMGLTVQRAGAGWQIGGPSHLIAALAPPSQPQEITDGR